MKIYTLNNRFFKLDGKFMTVPPPPTFDTFIASGQFRSLTCWLATMNTDQMKLYPVVNYSENLPEGFIQTRESYHIKWSVNSGNVTNQPAWGQPNYYTDNSAFVPSEVPGMFDYEFKAGVCTRFDSDPAGTTVQQFGIYVDDQEEISGSPRVMSVEGPQSGNIYGSTNHVGETYIFGLSQIGSYVPNNSLNCNRSFGLTEKLGSMYENWWIASGKIMRS